MVDIRYSPLRKKRRSRRKKTCSGRGDPNRYGMAIATARPNRIEALVFA
jgi:hypothetical protein